MNDLVTGVSHRLSEAELTDVDLTSIIHCAESLPYGESSQRLLRLVIAGDFEAYRLSPGLMLVEIIDRTLSKELFVFWLEGEGLFRQLNNIKLALYKLAAFHDCTHIGAMAQRWPLARKLLRTFDAQLTGYHIMAEI